jgi:hypothetical protein
MVEQGASINGFYTYTINDKVPVDGIFYVGWRQRSETFLNAGFDINTPHKGRQFYCINGNWNQSAVTGTLMIRPVTGAPLTTSIYDIPYKNKSVLHFRPNPAKDYIRFDSEDVQVSGLTYLSFFDMQGRELLKVPFSEQVDISSLHEGVYIIISSRYGRQTGYNRLIKLE